MPLDLSNDFSAADFAERNGRIALPVHHFSLNFSYRPFQQIL